MSRGPRVLVSGVVLSQPMGGVRRHNQELLPRLARLLAERRGALAVLAGREGLPFELPPPITLIASDVPAQPVIARAARETQALRRALAAARAAGEPFDLVHTGHLPAPRALDVPYTLTLHDLRSLALAPAWRQLAARPVLARAVRGARAVIAVSETVASELARRFRIESIRVVPNAADHFIPLPREVGPEAPILHVGHVEPRKNLALLVRALAVDPGLPPLLLAGAAKGGEDERLRELARELGVLDRVRFLGAFEERELAGLYSRAACVALPSLLEGFGIAALEAQRARAPLAIARAGALVEVAGSGTPSFAPEDPAECARALRAALAATPAELESACERAARNTWQTSAELWLEALLAASRPAGDRRS